ncbi:MAG TPA: Ig-like domain-containing protein [Vicinamibacterales bacterium]|nr:Ig-like domain-containing protein [Vicinamibacterales bacterium]
MTYRSTLIAICLGAFTAANSAAQTPPPAPALVAPNNGASATQPVTLQWTAVSDPDGPIGNYTWQVATTSAFSVVIADGFTDVRNGDPIPTFARLSGLPNGTYFWRVKTTQIVGGAVFAIDSPWSVVRTLTITGLGSAPGTPGFTAPANLSRFHALEDFDITWTAVPGAQYYLLEADDEPSFSAPQTLTLNAMQFGTKFRAGWGNEIPNVYYRVRAVSVDNVRGLPSAVLNVKIVNTAPVPPAPIVQSPVGGATVSVPIKFDWSDTPNPQVSAYDLDVDTDPNFAGSFGVLLVQGVNRSDYVVAHDVPLPPGTYFWRVRARHGAVAGPWSASGSLRVVASPATPPGLELLWIIPDPGTVEGGAPTQARVTLSGPAPPGGATVRIMSDMEGVEVPATVTIPAGSTDATVSPITTVPVGVGIVGALRADYGTGMQITSFGMVPLLFSLSLNTDSVAGGNTVIGTITLQRPAPENIDVTIVSSDTSLAQPPAHVIVLAGNTSASFSIPTATVAATVPVVFDVGTANDGYHAPQARLTIRPAGSAAPAPSLSTVTLTSPAVVGGTSATGTVTLTGPAPAGGASVQVTGSSSGTQFVNVPAGGRSAPFTITTSDAYFSRWGMIQASYGSSNSGLHGAVLRVDPDVPATPSLLAFGVNPSSTTAGGSVRGTVGLVTPAPPGGATISISSNTPAAQVPASVTIAAGNSATTFTVGTSAVGSFTSATITGSSGASTKETFLEIFPNPNAGPQLASVTPGVTSATGGSNVTATVTLAGAAPSGGASITMSTSSTIAQAPPIVTVPAGQTSAAFTITTSAVTQNTFVTVTGTFGNGSKSGSFTLVPAAAGDTTPPTASITSPAAGATVSGTISIQANASDNVGVTRVDFLVDGSLLSSDTTAPFAASWNTANAANGAHSLTVRAFDAANNQKTSAAVSVTVNNGTTTAPTLTLSGVAATIRRGQTFTATATVTNNGAAAASGFSVRVSFTPSSAMRLQSPTTTTQSVPTVVAGGSQNVAWQMRTDNAGTATLTMTLRDAGGATVRTASQTITIID